MVEQGTQNNLIRLISLCTWLQHPGFLSLPAVCAGVSLTESLRGCMPGICNIHTCWNILYGPIKLDKQDVSHPWLFKGQKRVLKVGFNSQFNKAVIKGLLHSLSKFALNICFLWRLINLYLSFEMALHRCLDLVMSFQWHHQVLGLKTKQKVMSIQQAASI